MRPGGGGGRQPLPAQCPSLLQAERSGNRIGQRGLEAPGPGKYTVKWDFCDRSRPGTALVRPCYRDELTPQVRAREEKDNDRVDTHMHVGAAGASLRRRLRAST